jgi:hypothetical protein
MRLVLVVSLVVLVACGGKGEVVGPSPVTAPVSAFPEWRMDRGDALNWMLGHRGAGEWLYADWYPAGGGGHSMGVVHRGGESGGEFFWVKTLTGGNFERFTYDAGSIYWREDHAEPGTLWHDAWVAYSWSDVRWLPRRLPAHFPVTIANTENRIRWHSSDCGVGLDNRYPVYVTFHGFETRNLGGDIGVEELLHTSFRVGGSPFHEHQWYSWRWGWVVWEYWRDGESVHRHLSLFNSVQTGAASPARYCTQ